MRISDSQQHYDLKVEYIAKSGYHLATVTFGDKVNRRWNSFWTLNLPKKIKIFTQRSYYGGN